MKMPEEHINPPSTIKEVGIHIGYMRQDINDLTTLVKEQSNNYATKEELANAISAGNQKHKSQDKAIKSLEDWNLWATRLVLGAVGAAVLGLVLKGNGVF